MSMSLSKDIDHLAITTAPSATTDERNEILLVDKTAEQLTAEVLPTIFGYLTPKEIMRARRVCTTWRDAARKTLIHLTELKIENVMTYNETRAMSTDLSNLQHLSICRLGYYEGRHKYSDSEDPDEDEAADTADFTTHDINIISNFTKLRSLEIYDAPLDGRYPVLFNFPLLQKLSIVYCENLMWDLEMLAGLPSLKIFKCCGSDITGDLRSLRMIKDNLEEMIIQDCPNFVGDLDMLEGFSSLRELALDNMPLSGNISSLRAVKDTIVIVGLGCQLRHIEGNFMDLADFPLLKELYLGRTSVTGDFRDIISAREHDFPSLEKLSLPWCRIERVSDMPGVRMATSGLRNFEHLTIASLGDGHKYSDGEDPDEEKAAETADYITHDINIISSLTNLHSLKIDNAPLNGRYPVLFNFPLLQTLKILCCDNLKIDLHMLAGLPSLKEFVVGRHMYENVTGNLRSLRVLNDTLEEVEISSTNVRGNFMDLADFPHLKVLDLGETNVTGDICEIRGHHFPALERLFLPSSVRGGQGYEFHSISEVPSFMHAIHLFLQRNFIKSFSPHWGLSKHSPDRYWYRYKIDKSESDESELPAPPFSLQVYRVGSRFGWCWETYVQFHGYEYVHSSCEINWLDPEPRKGSREYEDYIEELRNIQWRRIRKDFYRGYHQPPTKEEYRRLCERYWNEKDQVMDDSDGKNQILNDFDGENSNLDDSEEVKELLSRKWETRLAQKKKARLKKIRKMGKRTKQKNDAVIDTQPDFVVY